MDARLNQVSRLLFRQSPGRHRHLPLSSVSSLTCVLSVFFGGVTFIFELTCRTPSWDRIQAPRQLRTCNAVLVCKASGHDGARGALVKMPELQDVKPDFVTFSYARKSPKLVKFHGLQFERLGFISIPGALRLIRFDYHC